jgi:hypothetical protein
MQAAYEDAAEYCEHGDSEDATGDKPLGEW